MGEKIRVGVSACLMGESVRYDGSHKHSRLLTDVLGPYLEYVPVCPEVGCGMPIPREALRLVGNDPGIPRLVTRKTNIDYTERMQTWGKKELERLATLDLCGFIFMPKSPSSGMERVKVYNDKGVPVSKGVGIFARMFMDRFPLLPVEENGRLHDSGLRENFVRRLFVLKRWRTMLDRGRTMGNLVDFHTRHKYMIMSQYPKGYSEMGRLVAGGKELETEELFETYFTMLTRALSLKTTVKKNVNVLMHIMGYFKRDLTPDEKQELLGIIEQYKNGHVPLIVPITLLNHYVRKYEQKYLAEQWYLHPHPVELKLLNHV
ncbi:YbgA family protein [Desulfoplanes sp.]